MKTWLITGGLGYVGAHCAVEWMQAGYQPVLLDNCCNSDPSVLEALEQLLGQPLPFIQADVRDAAALKAVFERYHFDGVLHCASLKAVGESHDQPLDYFDNNVNGSLQLLKAMHQEGVKKILFSSSATVYGHSEQLPFVETAPLAEPLSPYGRSKRVVEELLQDYSEAQPDWRVGILRYFNPIGAHPSALIGEKPQGTPNNLVPYLLQVALGQRSHLQIFGNDYPTRDGTGVRDYLHICDLAQGHLAALKALDKQTGIHLYNLGTGQGTSVLELVQTFERVTGQAVAYQWAERRPGDLAECYACPKKAQQELNWQAQRDLETMLKDAWRWAQKN